MTLSQLSESYAYSADLLSRRLAQLRQEQRETRDPDRRFALRRRELALMPLLRQCRQLRQLTAHYYDRSYYRDERFTV